MSAQGLLIADDPVKATPRPPRLGPHLSVLGEPQRQRRSRLTSTYPTWTVTSREV